MTVPRLTALSATGGSALLLVLPHAGGAPSVFAEWIPGLPDGLELWSLDLPGRGSRMLEDPVSDLGAIVTAAADGLAGESRPVTLFGHSFGALVAFDLARELQRRGTAVRSLVVSGMAPPQTLVPRPVPSDAEVLEHASVNGSAPPTLAQMPELVELVLPGLRADYQMSLGYRYLPGPPLTCPVVAFGGADDAEVPPAELAAWGESAVDGCRTRIWPRGHMYLLDHPTEIAAEVADTHRRAVAR